MAMLVVGFVSSYLSISMTIYDFLSLSLPPLHPLSPNFDRSSFIPSGLLIYCILSRSLFSPYNLGYPRLFRPPPLVLHHLKTLSCMSFLTCCIDRVGYASSEVYTTFLIHRICLTYLRQI